MIDLKTEFCIIGKEKDSFIESYVGEPLTPSHDHEYFFIVIEILHKFLEGENIAEAITEAFRKAFYKEEHENDFVRFEESLKAINLLVKELEQEEGLILKNINIAVGALVGNELYLSQCNDAELYLIRKGYVSLISDGLSNGYIKAGEDLFTNVSNGTLEPGDNVLLSTGRMLRYITKNELGRHFYGNKIPGVLKELGDDLSTEVLGRVGSLAFEYQNDSEQNGDFSESTNADGEIIKPKKTARTSSGRLGKIKDSIFSIVDFFNFIPETARTIKGKASKNAKPGIEPELPSDLPMTEKAEPKVVKTLQAKKTYKSGKTAAIIASIKNRLEVRFSSRTIKIGAGVIGLLSVLLLVFIFTRGSQLKQIREFEDVLTSARTQVAEAASKANKQEAAQILANVEESLKPALDAKYVRTEANKIMSQIKEVQFQFDEVITIDTPEIVANVSTISDKGNVQGFIQRGNDVFAYNDSELIEILIDSVKSPIKLLDEGKIVAGTTVNDTNTSYFLTDKNKIIQFADGLSKFIDSDDGSIKPGQALTSFGSRLYLIDNTSNQIWRYSEKRDSLGGAQAYLENTKLPLAKSLAIDGAIYVITQNNQIIRYFGGDIDNFKIDQAPLLPPQLPTQIFTNEDSSFVYVLDVAEKRIMVYFKDQNTENLVYTRQYYFPSLNQVTAFAVQEDNKKIYYSDGETVYSTELK